MADRELSLRHACPLDHPPDYALELDDGAGGVVRIPVPKDIDANLAWREDLLRDSDEDPEYQATLRAMCATPSTAGCLFFINAFCWTYLQSKTDEDGVQRSITTGDTDVPFVTFPIQDGAISAAVAAIENGEQLVVEKAREMGASWLVLAVFVWMATFRKGVNFMLMSRVEELVDNSGDPDSLMWKVDYLVKHLPAWMRPPVDRRVLFWKNRKLASTIIGKSTTAQQGRAGRKTAVMIDEAAAIDQLKAIWTSLRYTSKCLIAVSTALGPGFFAQLCRSPKVRKFQMPWWAHPDKGRGRYEKRLPDGTIEIRSPWFDRQEAMAVDVVEIAQELGMDHTGGGRVVFPPKVIQVQRARVLPPLYMGDIVQVEGTDLELALRNRDIGAWRFADMEETGRPPVWKLWCELEECPETGLFRPPQKRNYAAGIDVSWGLGRSNSTMIVFDVDTGEQVGSAAAADMDPTDWGIACCMWGLWWGGDRGCAFLCPEANGGGGQLVVKAIRTIRYPWVFRHMEEGKIQREQTDTIGWNSNNVRKAMVAGQLRVAMAKGEVSIRDEDILNEAEQWIFYEDGGLGPAELVADAKGAATATHGDRVIGTMLGRYGALQCWRCNPPEADAAVGSLAWRKQQRHERTGGKGKLVLPGMLAASGPRRVGKRFFKRG